MASNSGETYGNYVYGQGYLTLNGKRIGATTQQDFEFIETPEEAAAFQEIACRDFTMTCDWQFESADLDSVYDWPVVIEQLMFTRAELEWGRWRAFEDALDRRLRWLR